MIPLHKTLILTGLIATLLSPADANADVMTENTESEEVQRFRPVLTSIAPSCPPPVPYGITGSRELTDMMAGLSRSITNLQGMVEEWGTLKMSGLLIAPPVSGGSGTFAVDINGTPRKVPGQKETGKYDFAHWFEESGKAEGTAQFSERIFNSLIASGTLQLAPEQAAIAESILRKQRVDQQLFQEQLERDRALRALQLDDFNVARLGATEARQVRIDAGDAAVERTRTAHAEADLVSTEADRQRTVAKREMDRAKAANEGDLSNVTLRKEFLESQAEFDKADAAYAQSTNNLRARSNEHLTAQRALADAMSTSIVTGTLPNSGVTAPGSSPTFGQQSFAFASEATPGQTFTQARGFASAVPATVATNINALGADQLPTLLGQRGADGNGSAAFPARARLIDAAGNQTIARIFDFLGNPSAASLFQDKPIVMAAGTIAVNPGWRTFQDYDGAIDVSARYEWKPARRTTCDRIADLGKYPPDEVIFNPDEILVAKHFADTGRWPVAGAFRYTSDTDCLTNKPGTPLAAAVSPLMERQNIDQASSRARQEEIALFLSASLAQSGQKAAGEIFNKFVRMRRTDVKTRSALPVVNSYGLGGDRFGFNVTSRLRAIADINRGKAGKVLEKQNFPVLVVFGLAGEDLRPRLVHNAALGTAELWEPRLVLAQTHRWNRARKRGGFHQGLHSAFFPGFPGRPMDAPSYTYDLLDDVSRQRSRLKAYLGGTKQYQQSETLRQYMKVVDETYGYLNQAQFGAHTELDIPADYLVGPAPLKILSTTATSQGRPSIHGVFPHELVLRRNAVTSGWEAEAVIVGSNLDQVDLESLAATPERVAVTKLPLPAGIPAEQAILVKFSLLNEPPQVLQIRLPIGAAAPNGFQKYLYSPMISVHAVSAGL